MSDVRQPPVRTGADGQRTRARVQPAAIVGVVMLAAVWAWWAWQDGGYFPVVVLPGTILLCLTGILLVGFAPWRIELRLSPAVIVAGVALVALAAWAALSAFWSPAPDVAVGDGQRIAMYAIAFGLGIGVCNLLGPRMNLSLVPLAFAGLFAGIATIIALHTAGNPLDVLETDGTLDYPLGYRNANAAFFAVALFPALGLASDRTLDWRLRAVALGATTLCIDFAMLSQSRASVPAMVVALIVYIIASPYRVRALSWLGLAVLPAIGMVPALTDLFHASGLAGDSLRGVNDEMQRCASTAGITSLAAVALGAAAAYFETGLPGLRSGSTRGNRAVLGGLAGLGVVAVIAFVVAVGNPTQWISDRVDEFRHSGSPDLSQNSSRFVVNLGSNRYDIWRVAVDDLRAEPLRGDGGGGFEYTYLRKRNTAYQNLRDAHSVELELLSELGTVGFALFATFVAAAVAGVMRARKLGPSAAALAAIALASASYWLVHTSVDWFWPYPAVTAPVIGLLGCASAPAVRTQARRAGLRWRRGVAIGALALLALTAVPPFLAQRYVNDAYASWRTDLAQAYDDLDRARALNKLSDVPLLAEGSIANAAGDRRRALAAFRDAEAQRPEEWATHYLLANLERHMDRAAAIAEIQQALHANPLDLEVVALARKLGVDPATGEVKRGGRG